MPDLGHRSWVLVPDGAAVGRRGPRRRAGAGSVARPAAGSAHRSLVGRGGPGGGHSLGESGRRREEGPRPGPEGVPKGLLQAMLGRVRAAEGGVELGQGPGSAPAR